MNATAMAAATNKRDIGSLLLSLRLSRNSVLNTGVPLPQAHRPPARWPGSETAVGTILFGLNDGEVAGGDHGFTPAALESAVDSTLWRLRDELELLRQTRVL